jgi:beta-N-acetylglucosaminidase
MQKIDLKNLMVPKVSQVSSGYDQAQRRFQEILTTKLGGYTIPSVAMPQSGSQGTGFIPTDVTSGVNGSYAERINAKLKGTPMEGLGANFDEAGAKYGINPLFLAGLAIHESNYGKSRIAQDKNNLFGFKAYDKSPYASAADYSSFAESIDSVAKYLSESYLSPGGKYFNGTSVTAIGKRYATDPNWAKAIERIASSF